MFHMFVTCEVSHAEISALNDPLLLNRLDMSVTCDVSQPSISQATPVGSPPPRHSSTATLSAAPSAKEAANGLGEQVAAIRFPAVHELVPETVYPESHVGWQVDPLASVSVQVPTAPLTMRTLASHAFSLRTQAVGGPSVARSSSRTT